MVRIRHFPPLSGQHMVCNIYQSQNIGLGKRKLEKEKIKNLKITMFSRPLKKTEEFLLDLI